MKVKLRFSPEQMEIDPQSVIVFPQGMPGFEACQRFKLFHEEDKPAIFWMQSLDDPSVVFSVAEPGLFDYEYEIRLTDADVAALQVTDTSDLAVLVLLYRLGEAEAALLQRQPSATGIEVNWRAPVLINMAKRVGLQKVLQRPHSVVRVYGE